MSERSSRYFRVTKCNKHTGETHVVIISAADVPQLPTYEVNEGWGIVSQIEELDGPPPLSNNQIATLERVIADHLKRKHGVEVHVMMEQKKRQPRVIAKHEPRTCQGEKGHCE